MRDYPAVPNVFRINSSSSILLDDKHKLSKNSEHEHSSMNGDINYRRKNNSRSVDGRNGAACTFINIDTNQLSENGNFSLNLNSMREDRISSPVTKTINDNVSHSQRKNNYALWIITPVAASFAVAIVIASLAGPQWLLTEEKLPNHNYNGTANFNVADDGIYITKHTKSSLWILCASQGLDYYCSTIDYFPNEEYSPDPNDSTMAIPYAITRSTPFFIVSGIVLLISYIVLIVAMCSHRHSLYFFTSGVLFIISGLLMLIGLIGLISTFKAEVGSKLRPKSSLQPPLFTFRYGQSFFLYVIGFISTEFVGVLNVFLYISLQQIGREKMMTCFLYPRTPEKIKDLDLNIKQFNGGAGNGIGSAMNYNCKKHPALPNGYYSPFTQRRYFFEKSQNCGLHTKNLAKSLNELYTEPAPKFSPFDLPQEFPLTRSVSTTTDIYSNSIKAHTNDRDSHRKSSSRDSLNDMCGITKGILSSNKQRTKSKDELFSEFCERAGHRPKPKDIYFIEYDQLEDDKSIYIVDNYASLRKNRRNSYVPSNIRKSNLFNSHSSLKDTNNKSYPKSFFDMDNCDRSQLNNRIDNNNYFQQNNSNRSLYQSRTLPRDFLKRNVEFVDDFSTRRVSASGVYMPNKDHKDQYGDYYKKSYDTLASRNSRHRDAYSGDDTLSVHWPNAIPASPSSFSTRSQFRVRSGSLYPQMYYQESPNGSEDFGTFDLDKIENDRRKSHASLFEIDFDSKNGTAV